ncbi:MAG: RHS repeat protein, partial [Candidatus Doudnabacteria bacterium]|nr:RHS repeat protein [Candidatus Doudnabacteria bacterium]
MMINYFIVLVCILFTLPAFSQNKQAKEEFFPSAPEQIATLSSETNYLVGGLISPLSGYPILRETDLVAKGAQNITLSRTYIPPYMPLSLGTFRHHQQEWTQFALATYLQSYYKGWQFYPHLKLKFTPRSMNVLLTESNGVSLSFHLSGPNYSTATLSSCEGISNTAGDTPSGNHDYRNTKISYQDGGNKIVVHSIDGTTRLYYRKIWLTQADQLYVLEKEILPNGKVLKYHYNHLYQPNRLESLDPQEHFVYTSLHINGSPWEVDTCHFTSSSGLTAYYTYEKRFVHIKFREGRTRREYGFTCPPLLTSVSSPFYRQESLRYCSRSLLGFQNGKDNVFHVEHTCFGESPHYRVHKLFLPVGPNDAAAPVHELSYHPTIPGRRGGTTTVKNSDGTVIIYHFSKSLLTNAIQYFGQDGTLKKETLFSWSDNQWLKALEIRDGQKNLLHRKSFEYDCFGNPILETLTGDLTGEGKEETHATKRIFSDDGKNLLLMEENEEGKIVSFSYLPNTNLITSKLTKDRDQIILREFSIYDDCNNLIQTISDDGRSEDKDNLSYVTQRTVKTYHLRQSAPFLHMPEWIEETYFESGLEKSLIKRHLLYDQHGNIAEEEVYDAQGKHAYTLYKTYNERGDILTETNPLGQKAIYTYDPKGRLKTSTNFSNKVQKDFHHDTKGRLRKLIETGDDGVLHTTSSEYDPHDRQIEKKDFFQNSTYYTYDPLVNKVTKTELPPSSSIHAQANHVTILSTYDPLGRALTKTDANGHTTSYRYNIYGSPTEIRHPDGSKEYFRYEKNGKLRCYTDPDGRNIYYKYDILGRILSKTYTSANREALAKETFTYNGFNLLTETDKEGNLKQYFYDGCGRKIREKFCGQVTDFAYDSLGRLTTICKHNGESTLFIQYERDLQNKITEERKTDAKGYLLYQVNYSYDKDGNQETVIRYINGQKAVDTFTYDSCQRQIAHQDPKGHLTKTTYNENFKNNLGQKVLQIALTDPQKITSLETQDALGRTIKKERLNPQDKILSSTQLFYDPHGNLTDQQDHLYENSLYKSTQTIHYTYNTTHRIASMTRAFGTKEEKATIYTYFPSGKIATKTLPDKVTLSYSYDLLGFLSRLDSSDGKIRHSFASNKLGYLEEAVDENYNIAVKRHVDPFGNIIQETFPNGLEVKKEYDHFNRLISLDMGSQGNVTYTYDPLFLRKIERISSTGQTLYQHTYEEYDLNGYLLSERLIGNLGQTLHVTDPTGRKTALSNPYFSQKCIYDSAGNLLSSLVDEEEHHYTYDDLSQLSSETNPNLSSTYAHDSLYNRTEKNGRKHTL